MRAESVTQDMHSRFFELCLSREPFNESLDDSLCQMRFPEQGERGFRPKVNSPSDRT
jgi:hypothetical protein